MPVTTRCVPMERLMRSRVGPRTSTVALTASEWFCNAWGCGHSSWSHVRFTWYRPDWTSTKGKAASGLNFRKSNSEIRNHNDFALGTGGDNRYIIPDYSGSSKITKVGLFRTSDNLSDDNIKSRIAKSGFTHYTEDVNQGRNGNYLYVLWALEKWSRFQNFCWESITTWW